MPTPHDSSHPDETHSGRGFASVARLELQLTPTEFRMGRTAQQWSTVSGQFQVRHASSYGMFALFVPRHFVTYEVTVNPTTEREQLLVGMRGRTRRLPSNYGMSAAALADTLNERLAHYRAAQ